MEDYFLNIVYTISSKLNDLPINNGQMIFVSDTSQIYFDFENKRVYYGNYVATNEEMIQYFGLNI